MLFQIYLFLVDVCVFLYGIFQILRKTTFEYYIIRYQLSTFTIMTLTNNQVGIKKFIIKNIDDSNDTSKFYRYLYRTTNSPTIYDLFDLRKKYDLPTISCTILCIMTDLTFKQLDLTIYPNMDLMGEKILYSIQEPGEKLFYMNAPYGSLELTDLVKHSIKMRKRHNITEN